jgi:hypothetical protein
MIKTSIFSLFVLLASTAAADVLLVSQSGHWGATCPHVVCSAPGDSWSYSFEIDSVLATNVVVGPGGPINNFEFLLNGVPVPSLSNAYNEAGFFPSFNDGGFALFPTTVPEPTVFGMWTGLFDIPPGQIQLIPANLRAGVYPVANFNECGGDAPGCMGWESVFGTDDAMLGPVVISRVPEPASVTLVATMLLVTAFMLRKRVVLTTNKR